MTAPHEILGVDRDADEEEIERAYRRKVKETHPDQGGSEEEFKIVRTAYEQLMEGIEDEGTVGSDSSQPDIAHVSYLNYEVITDHGWSINDDDLFEKAGQIELDPEDCGRMVVEHGETILEAAEKCGFEWPFACRGGACANCAIIVVEGEVSKTLNNILPEAMLDRGVRLSCLGTPVTDDLKIIYNVKHLPELDDLRLPPRPFRNKHGYDPRDRS